MDDLRMVFRDALELATRAKVEFEKKPLVKSQRGGDRPSPWFRIWSESVQNAVRLARLLKDDGDEPKTLDEELDSLMRGDE